MKRQGASHVLGVDMSVGMIDLALAAEASNPLGIEYRVNRAEAVGKIGDGVLAGLSRLSTHVISDVQQTERQLIFQQG